MDICSNKILLTNVHDSGKCKMLHSGKTTVTMKGDLKGYGTVLYHPTGIANILSLKIVKKEFRVTYDSVADNILNVHESETSK